MSSCIYKDLKDITSEGPVFNLWCGQGSWLPGGEKSSEFALGAVLHFCTGDSLSVSQPPHFTIKHIQADFLQGTQ